MNAWKFLRSVGATLVKALWIASLLNLVTVSTSWAPPPSPTTPTPPASSSPAPSQPTFQPGQLLRPEQFLRLKPEVAPTMPSAPEAPVTTAPVKPRRPVVPLLPPEQQFRGRKVHIIWLQWVANKWGKAIGPTDPSSGALPPWLDVGIAGGEFVRHVLKVPRGAAGPVIAIGVKGFEVAEIAVGIGEIIKTMGDPRRAAGQEIRDQLDAWKTAGLGGLTLDDVEGVIATAVELAASGVVILPEKGGFFPGK